MRPKAELTPGIGILDNGSKISPTPSVDMKRFREELFGLAPDMDNLSGRTPSARRTPIIPRTRIPQALEDI